MLRHSFKVVILMVFMLALAGCGSNESTQQLPKSSASWQVVVADDSNFSFGIKSDGTLWAWGNNADGQLGIGTTTLQRIPVLVDNSKKWKSVAIGENGSNSKPFVLALKTDGTLWSWGDNGAGQLGDGTTTSRNTPAQVGTDTDWTEIAAGNSFGVALKANGTLWLWGNVLNLGASNSMTTAQYGLDSDWVKVAAGQHIMAIKSNGTLWGWGNNGNGQIGNGTTVTPVTVPYQIQPGQTWQSVSVNYSSTHALRSDHTLWSWGFQGMGSLGQGTDGGGGGNVTTPGQIGVDSNWARVVSGAYNTMAIKTDGTLWGWGWNLSSSLGDGTDLKRVSPVPIGSDTDWQSVAVGGYFGIGLKTDGAFWGWGDNSSGQLGDTLETVSTTPRLINP